MQRMTSPSEPEVARTPVGVTIAQRQRRLASRTPSPPVRRSSNASLQELADNRRKRRHRRRSQQQLKRTAGKITKPVSSWNVFCEGALLYTACLVLPALVGTIYRLWILYDSEKDSFVETVVEEVCTPTSSWLFHWILKPLCGWYDASVLKTDLLADDTLNITSSTAHTTAASGTYSDVWTVAFSAVALATIRLLIVQWTVSPLKSTDALEAMIRCKSVHLLSSDYSQTPIGTPVLTHRAAVSTLETLDAPPMPTLMGVVSNIGGNEEDHALGLGIDDTDREDTDPILLFGSRLGHRPLNAPLQPSLPLQQPAANVTSVNAQDDDEDDDGEDLMHELADRLNDVVAASTDSTTYTRSIYAGPRYATAIFRLLYSTAAVFMAWYCFNDANFWPWYVGGKGSTANCWDLSGGLTVSGLDSDFDHHNHVLKLYFLWQASYHWHSGAFHILSMVLLLLHPPEVADTTFFTMRKNTSAYIWSLTQHLIGLGSIAVAYVFSSLRRLTAIGLFAFDVSSWFLHLLQVCINAPSGSVLACTIPAAALHQYVVVPVFLLARLGIWPALAWSALYDSERWLEQLERTLWPGSARQLRTLLAVQMTLLLATTTVYAKRLWFHDHVRRVGAAKR